MRSMLQMRRCAGGPVQVRRLCKSQSGEQRACSALRWTSPRPQNTRWYWQLQGGAGSCWPHEWVHDFIADSVCQSFGSSRPVPPCNYSGSCMEAPVP